MGDVTYEEAGFSERLSDKLENRSRFFDRKNLKHIKREGRFLLNHFIVFWRAENDRLKGRPRPPCDEA